MKKFILLLVTLLSIVSLGLFAGCEREVDNNDGKCDICGKAMYKKIGNHECCYKHYMDCLNVYWENKYN